MGFWDEMRKIADTPSKWAGQGIFRMAKGITGSDKFAGAGARMGSVSTSALAGDPFAFRDFLDNGEAIGMDRTGYRKAKQAGDWTGSAIGSLIVGGALAGGGAAAGEGGGAAAAGEGGAGGFTEAGIGDYLAAEGAGEGAGVGSSAGGFNWQNLVKNMAGKGGQGAQQGGGLSLPSLIAQQQVTEAARQAQEMLGGDTDLVNYMAQMQMRNNIRRAG